MDMFQHTQGLVDHSSSNEQVGISGIPKIGGLFCVAIGMIVMISWWADIITVQTVFAGFPSMKFNTALLFLISGFSLLSIDLNWNRRLSLLKLLPWVAFAFGGFTLVAYWLHSDLVIDEIFARDPYSDDYPGRMAPATAFNFILVALSIIVIYKFPRIAEGLAIAAHMIALAAVLGFLFDFDALYDINFFSTMALHTALTFMVLTIGVIFAIPKGIILTLIHRKDPSGTAVRYLLPAALIIPVTSGWIVWEGYVLDYYGNGFAAVLFTLMTIIVLSGLTILFAMSARQWYLHNEEIQQELLLSQLALVEQERELIQVRERFLAMLSHDMRNPVTGIIMSSDLLMSYQERMDSNKRLKHLSRIRYQANTMKDLVEDIMLVNKLQMDEFPYEPVVSDLTEFCQNHFQWFSEIEVERPHEFRCECNASQIQTSFDKRLMTRMINNMLRNAVKYSPDGGEITMSLSQQGNHAVISISDEGIGIPQSQQKKLFELFARAKNVGSIPGYGLGLAIVKRIVDVHNGKIEVESDEGKGTTFKVILPIRKNYQSLSA